MKIFLTLFVLLFSSSVVADDISDFQIEGMSVGDSLLDYFSEKKIINNKLNYTFKNNKFFGVTFEETSFKVYEIIDVYLKTNDKKYVIYSIQAGIFYEKNINDCYAKKDEIVAELTDIIKNVKITDYGTYKHSGDELGKSKVTSVYFDFISKDNINVACVDWSKEIEKERYWIDHLALHIDSKEYDYWINNEAY